MTAFLESLWESVFTPGTSPTLIVATNASFAALEFLLLALLLATRSIHFLILSLLSVGLWLAINWFAAELVAAQEKEQQVQESSRTEQKKEEDDGDEGDEERRTDSSSSSSACAGEMDTETDIHAGTTVVTPKPSKRPPPAQSARQPLSSESSDSESPLVATPVRDKAFTTGATHTLAPPGLDSVANRRNMTASGELSTDSEWEKIEGER